MCIKCEIKKIVGDVIADVVEVKVTEVPAGKIDTGLLLQFNLLENEKDALKDEIDAALKAAAVEVKARFEGKVNSLNRKTGEVVTEIVEHKAPAGSH